VDAHAQLVTYHLAFANEPPNVDWAAPQKSSGLQVMVRSAEDDITHTAAEIVGPLTCVISITARSADDSLYAFCRAVANAHGAKLMSDPPLPMPQIRDEQISADVAGAWAALKKASAGAAALLEKEKAEWQKAKDAAADDWSKV
jgi:hypothetical protein